MVRFLETAQPVLPLIVAPPLRILGMIAAPTGLAALDVVAERQRLERAVTGLVRRGLVRLQWLEGQTCRVLHRAMRPGSGPWHIFHFIGHGGFDPVREEGLLALCGSEGQQDPMTATELGRELADHPTLRLVVLNACESATVAKRDIFSSTAGHPGAARRARGHRDAVRDHRPGRSRVCRAFLRGVGRGPARDAAVTDARKGVRGDPGHAGVGHPGAHDAFAGWGDFRGEGGSQHRVEANTEARRHGGAGAGGASQGDTGRVMVVEKGLGMPSSPADALALPRLRQLLTDHYDAGELRTLCFDLGVDYDNLPGEGRRQARELVSYLDRRGQLADLLRIGRRDGRTRPGRRRMPSGNAARGAGPGA